MRFLWDVRHFLGFIYGACHIWKLRLVLVLGAKGPLETLRWVAHGLVRDLFRDRKESARLDVLLTAQYQAEEAPRSSW